MQPTPMKAEASVWQFSFTYGVPRGTFGLRMCLTVRNIQLFMFPKLTKNRNIKFYTQYKASA